MTTIDRVLAAEAAFERAGGGAREHAQSAAGRGRSPEPPSFPTVVLTRDHLVRFRAGYVILLNAFAELLDVKVEDLTPLGVIGFMARRAWLEKRDASRLKLHEDFVRAYDEVTDAKSYEACKAAREALRRAGG